jgi:N-acetylglutamate synthase-like GNAT family acetyltransferase
MIKGKYLSINDDLTKVADIHKKVYNQPFMSDPLSMYVLVFEEELAVGTGSILFNEGVFTLKNIAILPQYRNKGYGEFALRLLADKALLAGGKEVFLECPKDIVAFFQKYGFESTSNKDGFYSMKLSLEKFQSPCKNHCNNH